MSKIQATTAVICPIGTTIELYTEACPAIGQAFDIRHIDTKKVVQRAQVESFAKAYKIGRKQFYRVLAKIVR